jgi:CheY-like chemotaxis protein
VPYTLLLADDSVTIQRVIELTFADEDVQVVAVGDGEQAIAILNDHPPDIVLADIGMPKCDGYEVAQYIRTTPALAHIPVVLLTGAFEPVDEARAATVGVDAVLAKPFEPQLVVTKVKELLARPRRVPSIVALPVSAPPAVHAATLDSVESLDVVDPVAPTDSADEGRPVDDYFDRLDQAFASLAEGTVRPTMDAMLSPAPAEQAVAGAMAPLPTLSEAFAALLDAEQITPSPQARPVWPAATRAPEVAAVAPEELVERVTHDVLQRLSDRAVRETVAELVSSVAERMVRDEIDRIKASIRA